MNLLTYPHKTNNHQYIWKKNILELIGANKYDIYSKHNDS